MIAAQTTALLGPEDAAFHRLVTEGAHSQAVNQARKAGLTVGDVKMALSLSREEA